VGLECYTQVKTYEVATLHKQLAKQMSAERCACKPLANFFLPVGTRYRTPSADVNAIYSNEVVQNFTDEYMACVYPL